MQHRAQAYPGARGDSEHAAVAEAELRDALTRGPQDLLTGLGAALGVRPANLGSAYGS
jgi:hypothetical protein